MAAPNLLDDVKSEREKYGPTMTVDECVDLCNAVAWKNRDDGWGVSGKNFGTFGVRFDGTPCATDILHHFPTNSLVDCLIAAGAQSTPQWDDLGESPHGDERPWTAPIQPEDEVEQPHQCKLGVSWFSAVGLYVYDKEKFYDTLEFHVGTLKPDYVRIFWYLADGPWGLVGTGHLASEERKAAFVAVVQELLDAGIKPQVCVFGSWPGSPQRLEQLTKEFVDAFRPYADQAFAVDCVNEPGAIEFPEYGYVRTVGRMCADLGVPLLSLASPNSIHMGIDGRRATDDEVLADTEKLYGAMPITVNAITPHWGRNPWEPHRNLGQPHLKVINDEPRGIESSVSDTSDPATIAKDYQSSVDAGDEGYTFHGEPGVWDGYCDTREHPEWEHNNSIKSWWDVPRIDEIVKALHQVRGKTTTPPPPPQRSILYVGDVLEPGDMLVSPNKEYTALYDKNDGNFVIYHAPTGVPLWASHTDGSVPGRIQMQPDGNLVIVDGNEQAIWGSNTYGWDGATVQLQDDGKLVMYAPVWATE